MKRQSGISRRTPAEGFTLIETLLAITLLTVGLVSLAVLVVSSTRQTDLEDDRQKVLEAAQNLLEEVKASDPLLVVQTYDGQRVPVDDVSGELRVSVDSTDLALLGVSVTAAWSTGGNDMTFVLETQIYNSKG